MRFVGFTGHKDPAVHLKMIETGFPFDAVQMPLNPFDAHFLSFAEQVLPECARRGIAALGHEAVQRPRRADHQRRTHRRRSAALCDEPAGRHDHHRHGQARSAAAKREDRHEFQADDSARDASAFAIG